MPRISVVTPSYNQAAFLEETIRSVLLQGYPELEYFVIDGGSTDGSVAIIERYAPWLDGWVSERDRGQTHAINKGIERCTGTLFNWINSDDTLLPGALRTLGDAADAQPGALLCGRIQHVSSRGDPLRESGNVNLTFDGFLRHWASRIGFDQQAVWVPMSAIREVGGPDERYQYCFDWEWMMRLLEHHPVRYLPDLLARFRLHDESKTCALPERFIEERREITETYARTRGTPSQREEVRRFYAMYDWMQSIARLRSSGDPALAVAARIVVAAARQPWRLSKRFTWGAIRQSLTERAQGKTQ